MATEGGPVPSKTVISTLISISCSKVVSDLKARSKTLVEMAESASFYFTDTIEYDISLAERFFNTEGARYLDFLVKNLPELKEYNKDGIERLLRRLADDNGAKLKEIVQPIRVALTGRLVSPGIDEVMITLGKDGSSSG